MEFGFNDVMGPVIMAHRVVTGRLPKMICAVLYVYFVAVTLCFKMTSFYIEKINGKDTKAFMTSFRGTSFHICFGITVICFTRLPANGSSRRYDDSNDYNHNDK